jgi:uncharacterized membrane protein YccF (DUF307 family)
VRSLLHLLAIILFIFGGLSAFGWLLSTDVAHAVGFACFGLAAWAASSFTPPANLP